MLLLFWQKSLASAHLIIYNKLALSRSFYVLPFLLMSLGFKLLVIWFIFMLSDIFLHFLSICKYRVFWQENIILFWLFSMLFSISSQKWIIIARKYHVPGPFRSVGAFPSEKGEVISDKYEYSASCPIFKGVWEFRSLDNTKGNHTSPFSALHSFGEACRLVE